MSHAAHKILIVDDEKDILDFLEYNLNKEGFSVLKARNGAEAIALAKEAKPHLIVLDMMMPGLDGLDTCRALRAIPNMKTTLIVFLTAKADESSEITGFEAGADDYIYKPIKPRVLMSRLKGLLRRHPAAAGEEGGALQYGDFTIDKEKRLVTRNGREVALPRKEYDLLLLLTSKPGKVFAREKILNEVWGSEVIVGDRTIDVHIRKLREKLGEQRFTTLKGVGYKFEE